MEIQTLHFITCVKFGLNREGKMLIHKQSPKRSRAKNWAQHHHFLKHDKPTLFECFNLYGIRKGGGLLGLNSSP